MRRDIERCVRRDKVGEWTQTVLAAESKLAKPLPSQSAPEQNPSRQRNAASKANFPLGEVFAYRLASGAFVLLHIVDYTGNRDFGFFPIVAVLDWRGEKLPSADEVRTIPLKTKADNTFGPNWPWMLEVFRKKEKEFPTDRVIRLGVVRERHCDKVRGGYSFATWSSLDRNFEYSPG